MKTYIRHCTAVHRSGADDMLLSGKDKAVAHLRHMSVSCRFAKCLCLRFRLTRTPKFTGAPLLPSPAPHVTCKRYHVAVEKLLRPTAVCSSVHLLPSSDPLLQIQRDKNHPSIIVWSCGNESGFGKAHSDMAQFYRQLDPSRPTHYEVCCQVPQAVYAIISPHLYSST